MLEVFIKYICFVMLTIVGFFVIRKINKELNKKLTFKNVLLIMILQIVPTILYTTEYNSLNTFVIFFFNTIIYKSIFKLGTLETILLSSYLMILSFVSDVLTFLTTGILIDANEVRTIWYSMLICNIVSCAYIMLIINIKYVPELLNKITLKIENNKYIRHLIFTLLTFIVLCMITKNIYLSMVFNKGIISSISVASIFVILFIMHVVEKSSYDKLSKEYDVMFNYINDFEEWIEKEQFNRHEYKNQLAVLHCLTKEKSVKDKINEILADNINLEGQVVHELKTLPKGGIKGLMYYKSAIAQKKQINLTINVSLEYKTLLNKLSNEQMKVLCKLIGVYYDNAIEAATETRKKTILVEVYELKDKVVFVFSNTFKKHKNFEERNKKGISSKGEGRGNGLYFANKILEKNKWIESKQDIVDKYYIQQINIYKKEKTS